MSQPTSAPGTEPEPKKTPPSFAAWVLAGGSAFVLFLAALFTIVYLAADNDGLSLGGERVGLVTLEGVILSPTRVVDELEKMAKQSSVRVIVLRLDSPGGAVAPSQEIYEAVKRVRREHKKQVWASIGIVGASGAYYIAAGADKIYANAGSITGSIGVIAEWYNYGELLRWAKMKDEVLKSGALKDAGSPTRDMTPAERLYLQDLIDGMHAQFIAAVAEGRKMKVDKVKPLADGRVFTGQQALKLGMIDGVGDLQHVIREAAKSAGLKGDPQIQRPPKERRGPMETLLEGVARWLPPAARESMGPYEGRIKFQYLWR